MIKRCSQILPVFLAAALQVMPLLRNIFVNPAAGSAFAFILRWGIGTTAALETVDAVSGASAMFISTTNYTGTVGTSFSNSVVVSLVGTGNPAATSDGFILTNMLNTTIHSTFFVNGQSTTTAMPAGLSFLCVSVNNANYIYGSMTGTPTTAGTYKISVTCLSPGNAQITTNIWFNISGVSSVAPVITNQPVSVTNAAGGNVTLSVVAGGVPAPNYQWRVGGVNVAGANIYGTNSATLSFTNIHVGQAGAYTVVITNSAGSVTSSVANVVVTTPASPAISPSPQSTNGFQLSFTPVVGLTNTVLWSDRVSGGTWTVLTNVMPPSVATPVTVSDRPTTSNRFYRLQIVP